MNNLMQPSFPQENKSDPSLYAPEYFHGLSKLEYASIFISAGMLANPNSDSLTQIDVSQTAVRLAKAVLEEANK